MELELDRYTEIGRHALLSGLLDRVGDGIFLIEARDGRVVEANDPGCRLLGLECSAVLGHPVCELVPLWPDVAHWLAWCERSEAETRPQAMEIRRRDGGLLPIDLRVYRIADGERVFYGMIARDATATRQAEVALRERERHYQNVIDNTVDGYFAIDAQRRFVEVNDALCYLFGTPRDEWLGKTPLDFITEESRAELIRQMQRIDSSDRRRYQLTGLRKDGTRFPILLNTTTMRDAHGVVVGSFGFITDISAVVAAQEAVAESEHELRGILDNLQDTYYRTDTEGRLTRISPSVTPLLGYLPDELVGLRMADLYVDPAAREAFLCLLGDCNGQVSGHETMLRHKDGRAIWVLTNAHYVRDAAGRIVGVEGTSRDITERRQAEEQLRLAGKVFADSGQAIMITDAANLIVSVNRSFCDVTGYSAEEVQGKDPRLMASGRHEPAFFRDMWASVNETGSWRGEVWNRRKNGEVFPEWMGISSVTDETGKISHYVAIFSDISERKAVEARIEFLAHHDPLTHLPNRALFRDRVEQALAHADRSGARVALLSIDLDRFKTVNESLGHPVGDELLREAAKRLVACIRDTDTVSRQGGDEFLVVLTEIPATASVARVAEKMMTALSLPFMIQGQEVGISCSIGIGMFPEDGGSFDVLLKKADTAMHHAKDAGRNAFRFHTEHMTTDAMERLSMQGRLRHGIERNEFILHYQPLVDLGTGAIMGAEALVRWQPPGGEIIPPARFIPVAEQSGLIVPLGEWVLHEACRELGRLHAAGHRHLSISVNLSSIQFRRGDVADTVLRALAESGVPPSALELELTESVMLQGEEMVLSSVQRLKSMGVRLAIDDFGTGYSSLAYLKRFSVDKLKIDQSFVRDLISDNDDAAIVHAVIQMAKSLKLQVLAEGVETQAVADGLRLLNCDMVQGYWFGRPMEAAEFHRLIDRS